MYLCILFNVSTTVGEEDEVSIKDVAYMVAEAMDFTGEITVSLCNYKYNFVL